MTRRHNLGHRTSVHTGSGWRASSGRAPSNTAGLLKQLRPGNLILWDLYGERTSLGRACRLPLNAGIDTSFDSEPSGWQAPQVLGIPTRWAPLHAGSSDGTRLSLVPFRGQPAMAGEDLAI